MTAPRTLVVVFSGRVAIKITPVGLPVVTGASATAEEDWALAAPATARSERMVGASIVVDDRRVRRRRSGAKELETDVEDKRRQRVLKRRTDEIQGAECVVEGNVVETRAGARAPHLPLESIVLQGEGQAQWRVTTHTKSGKREWMK